MAPAPLATYLVRRSSSLSRQARRWRPLFRTCSCTVQVRATPDTFLAAFALGQEWSTSLEAPHLHATSESGCATSMGTTSPQSGFFSQAPEGALTSLRHQLDLFNSARSQSWTKLRPISFEFG